MSSDKKTQKMSKLALERVKEALFSNLRSQFSTPIDVIIGYAQILFEELPFYQLSKYEDDLNKIIHLGQILQSRMDEVLSFGDTARIIKEFDLKTFSRNLQFALLTSLNSIIGYCELMLEDERTVEQKQFFDDIERIHQAAKLFINYVNEIDRLAQMQLKNVDLLTQFKDSSILIHDLITSIPALEKKPIYQPKCYKGTVLVVEDNVMARDLLIRRITHSGFNAIPCGDATQVIDKISAGNIDLVLLQIIMTGANGFEILRQIKEHSHYYYIPVIVISPLKEIDAVVRCLEMGADDYLRKPFNPVIFNARIESSIEKKMLRDKEAIYLKQLTEEKAKSDTLLLNIVPSAIADRLKQGEKIIVERFPAITVVFIDMVNFSGLAEKLSAIELIEMLNTLFTMMDDLTDQFGLEKIKTMGDAYMAVSGAPTFNESHAEVVADFACCVLEQIKKLNEKASGIPVQVRLGIHTGPAVGGVIGKKKFIYDLWGRTINIASRMESQGETNRIQVSEATYQLLKDKFVFESGETIMAKGIGEMTTYYLIRRK